MTFVQCELVHYQASRLRLRQITQHRLQGSTLQQPNGAPMQGEHLGHVQGWKALAGQNDRIGQAARLAGIAIQPTDGFHAFATVAAANPPEQNAEAYSATEDGRITNGSLAILMSG